MKRILAFLLCLLFCFGALSVSCAHPQQPDAETPQPSPEPEPRLIDRLRQGETIRIVQQNRYPHNPKSFTQGLFFYNDQMYESSGRYGSSKLYKNIDIETGAAEQEVSIAPDLFAEGSVVFDNTVYVLTWQEHFVQKYNPETLELTGKQLYPREGWGLTTDGESLIATDGSASVYFLDADMKDVRTITATYDGEEVDLLNELEYIDGCIFANVWLTNEIAVIDPEDGTVLQMLDMTDLCDQAAASGQLDGFNDVLNGIAYDANTQNLYVTGKDWPLLFECRIETDNPAQ